MNHFTTSKQGSMQNVQGERKESNHRDTAQRVLAIHLTSQTIITIRHHHHFQTTTTTQSIQIQPITCIHLLYSTTT
jgi:hypothetical protein